MKQQKLFTSFAQVKRVCIFRLSAIGDILNLIPSVELLLKNYPQVEVTWIIGSGEYNLFRHLTQKYPQLTFMVFNKRKTSYFQAYKQFKELSKVPFDLLIHAQTSLRANFLSTFIKAKLKVGYSKERSYEGHSLVVDYNIPYQNSMHVVFNYFDLFKPFFSEQDCLEFKQKVVDTKLLYIGEYPQHLQEQKDLKPLIDLCLGEPNSELAKSNISPHNQNLYRLLLSFSNFAPAENKQREGRLIFINPASSAVKKNWTKEGYVALIKHLIQSGHRVVVTGGKNHVELELVNGVAQEIKEYILEAQPELTCKGIARSGRQVFFNLAGKTTLTELCLFISLADLVISPDSGPMHLASCLGIPTIGLFAYINPLRSGPIQGVSDVVSVFHKNTYQKDLEFTDHQYVQDLKNWHKKPPRAGKDLMKQISPQEVIERTDLVLKRLDLQQNVQTPYKQYV
ncbi:glycosyltransferase family 9 protein [Psittacicella gerlachiana]|uniref:Uncharacterized protein n=1 Tax=Psittacicella gerlachiana TaxID=2028574 RepID=A0A3A1YD56_9GAMM|nr:glycosyltransferase family 9 protein [Psittacicella gerlachiana]RIY35461.1 hypothetical protein CKF59_03625 [Psittacicella gerlachiana]